MTEFVTKRRRKFVSKTDDLMFREIGYGPEPTGDAELHHKIETTICALSIPAERVHFIPEAVRLVSTALRRYTETPAGHFSRHIMVGPDGLRVDHVSMKALGLGRGRPRAARERILGMTLGAIYLHLTGKRPAHHKDDHKLGRRGPWWKFVRDLLAMVGGSDRSARVIADAGRRANRAEIGIIRVLLLASGKPRRA